MAGEDFDGDDDDEVTKMGVCQVHACLQGWHNGFQIPLGDWLQTIWMKKFKTRSEIQARDTCNESKIDIPG